MIKGVGVLGSPLDNLKTFPVPPSINSLHVARKDLGGTHYIKSGCEWPPKDLIIRQRYQKFSMSLYTGEYAYFRKWIAIFDNIEKELPYTLLKLNYFKLIADKIVSLAFNNELLIKTGNEETDRQLQELCNRVGFEDSIRRALLFSEIYGDSIIRVYKDGINVLPPYFGIKNVSDHDIDNTESITLYEPLTDTSGNVSAVRFEIHYKNRITEFVHSFNSGTLGSRIRYEYYGRVIPERGKTYYYPELDDVNTCQWCTLNKDISIYGTSAFDGIKDIVFSLESLVSARNYTIMDNAQPSLIVGLSMFATNEETGSYELKKIKDKYLIRDSDGEPKYLEWGGDNTVHARELQEDLMQNLYELSEISKSVMTGDYKGQVSNETLETSAKSATERASRDVGELWYQFRNALFSLARLNGIDISLENLTLTFNISRTLTDQEIAEIATTLQSNQMLSRRSILKKYFGFTDEQCDSEFSLIESESREQERSTNETI